MYRNASSVDNSSDKSYHYALRDGLGVIVCSFCSLLLLYVSICLLFVCLKYKIFLFKN